MIGSYGRRFNSGVGLFAGVVCAAVYSAAPAMAADTVFTVGNYPVEARASDAVLAKKQALADGQAAAFQSLLKRLVPVTAYAELKRLGQAKSGTYLDGVAVRSERNSRTEYIATLDYVFTPDAVRTLMRQHGVPFVEAQAGKAVLVPIFKSSADAQPERALGTWGNTWRGLDLTHTLTPLQVSPLSGVIQEDTIAMLAKGERGAAQILKTEYDASEVIAAIAVVDEAAKRLHVTLSGRDFAGPINWRKSYPLSPGELDYAMEYAAVVSLGVLEGRWKARQQPTAAAGFRPGSAGFGGAASTGEPVAINAVFQGVAQWYQIRETLGNVPGISGLQVDSLTSQSARVRLQYPGGGAGLAAVLNPRGLSLTNNGYDWRLQPRY